MLKMHKTNIFGTKNAQMQWQKYRTEIYRTKKCYAEKFGTGKCSTENAEVGRNKT